MAKRKAKVKSRVRMTLGSVEVNGERVEGLSYERVERVDGTVEERPLNQDAVAKLAAAFQKALDSNRG